MTNTAPANDADNTAGDDRDNTIPETSPHKTLILRPTKEHLVASKLNARMHHTKEAIGTMAASLASPIGQLQPIALRSLPDTVGAYEVIAGQLRLLATRTRRQPPAPVPAALRAACRSCRRRQRDHPFAVREHQSRSD